MVVVGLSLLLLPQVASAEILSVKGASANFRAKPGAAGKIKFSADRFYPVEVLETKNGWSKIKDFEGDEAWVASRLLAKQPSIVISADKANIREAPGTSSDVLFKAERGEVYKIEQRKDRWLKVVDSRGDGGWIRDDMSWGEPIVEKVADKLEKVDGKSTEKERASNAKDGKAADHTKGDKAEKSESADADVPEKITEPEAIEALCRAYLDDEAPEAKPKPKAEKAKPKPEKAKPKAEKAKPKPAKPAQKKK